MNEKEASNSTEREALVGALVIVFALIIALVYFSYFFLIRKFVIGSSEEWGQFGDYFGGLVNPAVGIATVLLVIWTLRVTRKEASDTRDQMRQQNLHLDKQVSHLEREQTLAEMHKRLDGALAHWNLVMSQTKPHLSLILLGENSGVVSESFRDVLYQPGIELRMMKLRSAPNGDAIHKNWDAYLNECVNLLIELKGYCTEYEQAAGNRLLTDFYRRRVDQAVRAMSAIGILPNDVKEGLRTGRFLGDVSTSVLS